MMNESFNSIRDTRQHAQVRHDLYEIIAMTIAAMIGNCDGWDEIEDFCQSKEMWLREHMGLELEHGIPSETTFARVWGQIDPDAFRACFTQWTNRVHEKLTGEVISIQDLKKAASSKFKVFTYDQAIEYLSKADRSFEYPVYWGVDLKSKHERYLCEEVAQGPVFIINYQKEIKVFYMRLNDDMKTVAACDLLVPGVKINRISSTCSNCFFSS